MGSKGQEPEVESMDKNPRKLEKKKILIAVLVGLFIVFMIPIKTTLKDGGTKVYMSMFYKVVCRHAINPEYEQELQEQGYSNKERYLTGTDVYIFPFHFFAE
ncbi:MAG: hypothetical protein K2O03_05640 [Lachnospiraceae bacterium]|nr:hypothetical protein [Lachnospiraceae bacterium]